MEIRKQRKLKMINVSLIVTIPKQACDLYGFKDGDKKNLELIVIGVLNLRKAT